MYSKEDFSYVITQDSISVSFQEKIRTILVSDSHYEPLKEALKKEDWEQVLSLLSPADRLETVSAGEMYVSDNQVFLKVEDGSDWAVPTDLNETILRYLNSGKAFQYLVLFANKLRANPSTDSVEQLFTFLTRNKFVLTQSGNFIAYKRVRHDFKDIYTGTMDNSIGQVVVMDRSRVNANREQTCSYGLHVANYYYASSCYSQAEKDQLLLVEVNPADVVSVPTDYNFSKMRVCRYKVLEVCQQEVEDLVYTDSDWE